MNYEVRTMFKLKRLHIIHDFWFALIVIIFIRLTNLFIIYQIRNKCLGISCNT